MLMNIVPLVLSEVTSVTLQEPLEAIDMLQDLVTLNEPVEAAVVVYLLGDILINSTNMTDQEQLIEVL